MLTSNSFLTAASQTATEPWAQVPSPFEWAESIRFCMNSPASEAANLPRLLCVNRNSSTGAPKNS